MEVKIEVDEIVHEILKRCSCLNVLHYFCGVKKNAFLNFTLEDIQAHLPASVPDKEAANKIYNELIAFKQVPGQRNTCAVPNTTEPRPGPTTTAYKREVDDCGTDTNDFDDGDVKVLDGPVRPQRTMPDPEVNLESVSDSDGDAQPNVSLPAVKGRNNLRNMETRARRAATRNISYKESMMSDDSSSSDSETEGRRGRNVEMSNGVWTVRDPKLALAKLRKTKNFLEDCVKIRIVPDSIPQKHLHKWDRFFTEVGKSYVVALELLKWTWQSAASAYALNLNRILSSLCPRLEELSLCTGVVHSNVEQSAAVSSNNLKRLKIKHAGKIRYMDQLKSILQSANKLEKIEYWYWDYEDLEAVLNVLVGFEDSDCEDLRAFTLRSYKESGYLKKNHLEAISKIPMKNLEVLEIGNGYWEDCRAVVVEKMLKSFQFLTSVTLHGNFQGDSLHKPDIVINLPALSYLKFLSMGADYEFESTDEAFIPRKKMSNEIVISEEATKELFSVSVKLPLLLQLETLALGNMYKVADLHFASLKSLKTFRVGSPWHLSVIFPPENSRNNSYPLVTELQLPDWLKDPSFVAKIPERFPNLKKCRINLPSVIVLRTFLTRMQHSKLESLILKTQFDFSSSLEECLLSKTKLQSRKQDLHDRLIQLRLMDYAEPMRKKFIEFFNIQLPLTENEIRGLEDDGSYDGINSLKRLKCLHMEHIPRLLRIPKGSLHWSHHQAKFTFHHIGRWYYPVTDKSLEAMISMKHLDHGRFPNYDFERCSTSLLIKAGFSIVAAEPESRSSKRKRTSSGDSPVSEPQSKCKVRISTTNLLASSFLSAKKEKE